MRPDPSTLGANVGFGYLTDDDDDDATGGAVASEFDATVNAGLVSTAGLGVAIAFQIDAAAGGSAQTNGSIRVSLSGVTLSATPSTTALAGWTEAGWTLSGSEWFNVLTKASVSVGTTSPTFSATASTEGTLTITTNYGSTHAPHTAEATGLGNSRSVTIADYNFDAIVWSPADPGTWPWNQPIVCTVDAIAGGGAQTNGTFTALVYDSYGAATIVTSITTDSLGGWSETGWSEAGGVWQNTFTRASVPLGTTSVQFSINCRNSGDVYIDTVASPATDQDTGNGNFITVELV